VLLSLDAVTVHEDCFDLERILEVVTFQHWDSLHYRLDHLLGDFCLLIFSGDRDQEGEHCGVLLQCNVACEIAIDRYSFDIVLPADEHNFLLILCHHWPHCSEVQDNLTFCQALLAGVIQA